MAIYQLKQAFLRGIRGCRSLVAAEHPILNVHNGLDELSKSGTGTRSAPHDEEEPLFLLATGWRTGSTLLQRILVTDPDLLLWGEPHGRMGIVSRAGDMVASFDRRIAPDNVILTKKADMTLSGEWIANLYPRTSILREALQSMVYDWLARPAMELGYTRWGLKEVRLGQAEARLLRWLFPKAKFVVITRNPYDSFRSALQLGPLWERWPDRLVNNACAYGRLWNRLVLDWRSAPADFPFRFYRLEDLTSGRVDFEDLASFTGLDIDPQDALTKKVGSGRKDVSLTFADRKLLDLTTAPARRWLGYA